MSAWIEFWKQLDKTAATEARRQLEKRRWSLRQEKSGWAACGSDGYTLQARSLTRLLELVEEHEELAANGGEGAWFA